MCINVYMVFHRCSVLFYGQQRVWSVLLTFVATLIVYFIKKVDETYWCSSSVAYQEKRTDWILRIFTSNDENLFYLPIISVLYFFEGKSDQGATELVIKPFDISQSSRIVSLSQKKCKVFPNPLLFFMGFLDIKSNKFWDQSHSSHYQYCLKICETISWHKLWCSHSSNILQYWVGWRDLIYICKMDHSRISVNFSRNWVGLNNLCEILWVLKSTESFTILGPLGSWVLKGSGSSRVL